MSPPDPTTAPGPLVTSADGVGESAVYTTDLHRRITTWTVGAAAMYGYPECEALGMSDEVLYTAEDREAGAPAEETAQAAATGLARFDRWHVRTGGSRFWGSGEIAALRGEDGGVRGFVTIVRYDPARSGGDLALRRREEDLEFILDVAGMGRWSLDLRTRHATRSPLHDRIFGYPEPLPAWTYEQFLEHVLPDHRARVDAAFVRAEALGEDWDFECPIRRADGAVRWIRARGRVYVAASGPYRMVGVVQDVTQQRENEASLRATNEELERRVRERTAQVRALGSRLAIAEQEERRRIALVLHDDLQQRLYGVAITLSLVGRAEAEDERAALLDRATDTLAKASTLARNLAAELSPSVLETDRLGDVLRWLAERSDESLGLEVVVEGEADVPDPSLRILLYHLVREALLNVAKHAETRAVRVRLVGEACRVEVTIEDDGVGFDPAKAQAPNGFGLASIRERLEIVGGRFEIASAPGEGTRLTLSVPRGNAEAGEPDAAAA